MEENTLLEVSKAIEIVEALKDVKRIAQKEIDEYCGKGLYCEIDNHAIITSDDRASLNKVLANQKVIEIVKGIIELNPHASGNIYSRIFNSIYH